MRLTDVIRFSAIILFMALFLSCKRSIKGEGSLTNSTIEARGFTDVGLYIPADVKIVFADTFNCVVTAQKNISDAITVKVNGDELEIKSDYSLDIKEPVSIVISMPVAERIQVNGSGDISFINASKGDKLKLYLNGSGSINAKAEMREVKTEMNGSGTVALSGSCRDYYCEMNGSGNLNAFELVTENAEVVLNGSGDAAVTTVTKLKAEVRGSGNIKYKGQPHVTSEIVGSGGINKAE